MDEQKDGGKTLGLAIVEDAAPAAMARALFLALMDPTHPDLDYLRGNAKAAIECQDAPPARAMCAPGMQEGVI